MSDLLRARSVAALALFVATGLVPPLPAASQSPAGPDNPTEPILAQVVSDGGTLDWSPTDPGVMGIPSGSLQGPGGGQQTQGVAPGGTQYPLRHSFSIVPPPYSVPYSCYSISGGYYCRSVYGYEEGGAGTAYDQDYLALKSAVTKVSGTSSSFGRTIVSSSGNQYDGCYDYSGSYWRCDYATEHNTHRTSSSGNKYWVKVLRDWSYYTATTQVACASTVVGVWVGVADVPDLGQDCLTDPYSGS